MNKIIENYIILEEVGSGQYGKVFKGKHMKTDKIVAIKVIKWDKFKEVPKLHEFTQNEVQILSNIDNENVIKFIEMLRTSNNVYLIYEFCNGGNLEEFIKKKKIVPEKDALEIFDQIINAMKSIIKENILHRDIKPGNILFHENVIKLADFGFCKALMNPTDLTQTMVGSPIYMAPEILKGCNYSLKADIWSMGVVLFEMLFGYCPYEDRTIVRLINQIDHKALMIPKHINNISKNTEKLLESLLVVDPAKRIEWNDLLAYDLNIKKEVLKQISLDDQNQFKQLQKDDSAFKRDKQDKENQEQNLLDQIIVSKNLKIILRERNKILYTTSVLDKILENPVSQQLFVVAFFILKQTNELSTAFINALSSDQPNYINKQLDKAEFFKKTSQFKNMFITFESEHVKLQEMFKAYQDDIKSQEIQHDLQINDLNSRDCNQYIMNYMEDIISNSKNIQGIF